MLKFDASIFGGELPVGLGVNSPRTLCASSTAMVTDATPDRFIVRCALTVGGKRSEFRLHFRGRTSHSTRACVECRVSRCGRGLPMRAKHFQTLLRPIYAKIPPAP